MQAKINVGVAFELETTVESVSLLGSVFNQVFVDVLGPNRHDHLCCQPPQLHCLTITIVNEHER